MLRRMVARQDSGFGQARIGAGAAAFQADGRRQGSEWLFETAEAGILEEMCEEGYFDEAGRRTK